MAQAFKEGTETKVGDAVMQPVVLANGKKGLKISTTKTQEQIVSVDTVRAKRAFHVDVRDKAQIVIDECDVHLKGMD